MDFLTPVIERLIKIGQDSVACQTIKPEGEDDNRVFILRDKNGAMKQVGAQELLLARPRHAKSQKVLADAGSFIDYVERFKLADQTVIFSDPDTGDSLAIIDYNTPAEPGWCKHVAYLSPRWSEDWTIWAKQSGQMVAQDVFARFIEENARAIVSPPAGQMEAIALEIEGTTEVKFGKSVNLQNGATRLNWVDNTTAKSGSFEIPRTFVVRMPILFGEQPIDITCAFRYQAQPAGLKLGFDILRKLTMEREAIAKMRARFADLEGVPVYLAKVS